MALIFSLYATCRDAAQAMRFAAHFHGIRWTLTDGTEITLDAQPYSEAIPFAPEGAVWVTPSSVSTYGIRDDRDAVQMTELGERLYQHLRTAPELEWAIVGIEVDQFHSDAAIVDMVRGRWTGLVVNERLAQQAGAPITLEPFRPGMSWHPYIGEWQRSGHHAPDIAVVTCLGCDQPIRDHELVRLDNHGHSACCVWHPYHLWCIREAPPDAVSIMECADCGAELDLEQLRRTVRWGTATPHHLHVRAIGTAPPFTLTERVDTYAGKPAGVSRRAMRLATEKPGKVTGHELHELVHDACPTDDPWRLRLRAAPGDDDLRLVYADDLEQRGELDLAKLVRLLVEIPEHELAARARLSKLRQLCANVPRGWLRDVCRRHHIQPP